MPSSMRVLTLAFATGTCGSETWAGVTPSQMKANIDLMVAAGKSYIVSTGGASGAFRCASDANFAAFVNTYYTANMLGVDFDIEGGLISTADVTNLVSECGQTGVTNLPGK